MQITTYLTTFFGVLIFLFIFWKRQKEDLSSEIIFKSATQILIGTFIGFLIAVYFKKEFWLWLGFCGGITGLGISVYRLKIKFNEVFEAFVIASLPWLATLFLADSVAHSSLSSFLGFLVILFIIFISYWLDSHYKNFVWYKSGRIGFSGAATLALVFILRIGIALGGFSVLSFVGAFEPILSGIGLITSILLLVKLGKT